MSQSITRRRSGFTLVEMLVVITIIALLAAILIPVAQGAIAATRRARNGVEIANVVGATEQQRGQHGGLYPPSFGEAQGTTYAAMYSAGTYKNTQLYRYLLKAYPKISSKDIQYMFQNVADNMDQASALVFWLNQTYDDPRHPFTANGDAGTPNATPKSYYEMDETRLLSLGTTIPAFTFNSATNKIIPARPLYGYKPPYAKESCFIYMEAKHYPFYVAADRSASQSSVRAAGYPGSGSVSAENSVRPVIKASTPVTATSSSLMANYVNHETFQLFCAGLDGRFSADTTWIRKYPGGETGLKFDNSAQDYDQYADDRDNQTNFSEGAPLESVTVQQ